MPTSAPTAILACCLSAGAAAADTWRPLSGSEIAAALTERTVLYDPDSQSFYASGRTRHRLLRDRWGWWEVRGDTYCSLWPPREDWDCFAVEVSGDKIRFLGQDGSVSEGTVTE